MSKQWLWSDINSHNVCFIIKTRQTQHVFLKLYSKEKEYMQGVNLINASRGLAEIQSNSAWSFKKQCRACLMFRLCWIEYIFVWYYMIMSYSSYARIFQCVDYFWYKFNHSKYTKFYLPMFYSMRIPYIIYEIKALPNNIRFQDISTF